MSWYLVCDECGVSCFPDQAPETLEGIRHDEWNYEREGECDGRLWSDDGAHYRRVPAQVELPGMVN